MTASGYLTKAEEEAQRASWFAAMFGLAVEDREELAGLDDESLAAAVEKADREVAEFRALDAFAAGLDRRRAVLAGLERLASRPLLEGAALSPGAVDEMLARAAVSWAARDRGFRKLLLGELGEAPAGFDELAARRGQYGATVRELAARSQRLRNEAQAREYERAGVDPREPLPGPEAAAGEPVAVDPAPAREPVAPLPGDDYCVDCGSRLGAGHFEGCPVLAAPEGPS